VNEPSQLGFVSIALPRPPSAEELTRTLAAAASDLTNSLPTIDGGGWRVVSHHLTPLGDKWVLTVMIERSIVAAAAAEG
jgi:hypothetical protein